MKNRSSVSENVSAYSWENYGWKCVSKTIKTIHESELGYSLTNCEIALAYSLDNYGWKHISLLIKNYVWKRVSLLIKNYVWKCVNLLIKNYKNAYPLKLSMKMSVVTH